MFVVTMILRHTDEEGETDRPFITVDRLISDSDVELMAFPIIPLVIRETAEKMIQHIEENGL